MEHRLALSQPHGDRQPGSFALDSLHITECATDIHEARLLHLQGVLPSIVDVVLAQSERERLCVLDRLERVSEGLGLLPKDFLCGDAGDACSDLHKRVHDLRSRASHLFEGSEVPGYVPRLSTNHVVELSNALWECREQFWRKLYEVPFVQRSVLEVVERALQGERRMSRTLFAPRRLLVDGDTAGRDLLLKDRAVAALAHVRSVEGGVSEPNTLLSAIAETLISIPLPPEKNLVLMGEYKRRYQTAGVESGEGRQTLGLPENNPAEYHEELLFREARYLRIRNYLVMANAGLTHSQSRRFIGGRDDGDDIRQSGFVGLVESVERFDASVGFAFSTSARSWIEKELHDARGKGGEVVSVPRAKRKEFSLYRSAEGDVSKIAALVADGLLAAADVSAFATLTRPVRRLNSPLSQQSEERSLSDIIADDKVAEVDSRLRNDDTRGSVDGLLRELCPTEREIVTLAFGLNGLERHSDAEIAERLNVKKSFVRARKERALHLLQRRARGLEQKHRD